MVKNCGSKVHIELATRESMDLLRSLALVLNLNRQIQIDKLFLKKNVLILQGQNRSVEDQNPRTHPVLGACVQKESQL